MTCATCKYAAPDSTAHTGLVCTIQLPRNLIHSFAHLLANFEPWDDLPPAPVRPQDGCDLHEEEDFDPIDTGDVV
jgi:hypothetical protein